MGDCFMGHCSKRKLSGRVALRTVFFLRRNLLRRFGVYSAQVMLCNGLVFIIFRLTLLECECLQVLLNLR
jgi:hypothetical protein